MDFSRDNCCWTWELLWWLSGKVSVILNISRTGCVALMSFGSQSEETSLCIREQSISLEASQSAVRRRWLSLCTVWPSRSHWPSGKISSITKLRLPILQLSCRLFLAKHHITPVCQPPLQPIFGSLRLLAFPRAKIAVESEKNCECDSHTVHKVGQRRLTADWLAPRESDCSSLHSKVFFDWLPYYIKATGAVLEIFKMVGHFPNSPFILYNFNGKISTSTL